MPLSGVKNEAKAGKGRSFPWAIAMIAVSVAACTATSSNVSPQLQAQGGGGLVAETLASAAESAAQGQTHPGSETAVQAPAPDAATALALAATGPSDSGKQAVPSQVAPAAQAKTAEAASPSANAVAPVPIPAAAAANAAELNKPDGATQLPAKGVQLASYTTAPRPMALATPAVDETADGSVMRLFVDNPSKKKLEPHAKKPTREYNYSLPGVRENLGLEIKRRSSLDDDGDIDANEEDSSFPVQLASAGGLARILPRGLEKQRESVETACLKPRLLTMLKSIERHFRRPVMITSGYRSPSYNRLVRGAPRSLHMLCEAADIQVQGVSKWEIARYVRALPGRGGVGTYCHTDSVHVDIGPERDWNWRCGGRRG
jgi:uncharacterized protein YcbK (DUF882 family)